MCTHAVIKILPFIMRYVPDWCKTQQMCDKATLEIYATLESAPDCYKNQQMWDKVKIKIHL